MLQWYLKSFEGVRWRHSSCSGCHFGALKPIFYVFSVLSMKMDEEDMLMDYITLFCQGARFIEIQDLLDNCKLVV